MTLSILTITYQAEQVLERTLQSVLNQTCSDFEYCLVDGASTDGTLELIGRYAPLFEQKGVSVRWTSAPDGGIYDAMNKALKMAQGSYVWFMNAGDEIAGAEVVGQVLSALPSRGKQPDFLYGETLIVDAEGNIMGQRRLKAPAQLTWKSFRMGMKVCHQSMIVRRSLAPEFDLQYRYSADFDWAIRCLKKAEGIQHTGLILSHFLDGGVSKKKMKASLKERFRIMSIHYGMFPTALRHLWFVSRAAWFKLRHGWI
jgi:glycosyltransferase involved in cell wall biosynthesis